jgi:superfamily II DNA or RNA helicase
MPLSDINYKRSYDSNDEDVNIIKDFYIPTLENSIKYDRVASYFRSSSFLVNAPGLSTFIRNSGKIRLIVNVVLAKEDILAIEDGEEDEFNLIKNYFDSKLENLKEEITKNRYRFLAYLISKNQLEVKVGVIPNDIEHSKYGIFYDDHENIVSFNGSINESIRGWTTQGNKIKVFTNWTERRLDVEDDIKSFERLWNNQGSITKVYDFSEAMKEDLIQQAGLENENDENFEEILNQIEIEEKDWEEKNKKPKFNLWKFQNLAIKAWEKNGYVGLLEMATGTGKTFTAINGLLSLQNQNNKLLTVIVCHSRDLANQWQEELYKFGINPLKTVNNSGWNDELKALIYDLRLGAKSHCVVVTSYATYYNEYFLNQIRSFKGKKFLICDEAHTAATKEHIKGLIEVYDYRLGLTATPYGYFDDLGHSKMMMTYFGCKENDDGEICSTFVYNLEDAINGKWAREPALVKYKYYLHRVELEQDEIDRYKMITARLSWNKSASDLEKNKIREMLIFERANIIKNAQNKIPLLKSIIEEMSDIEYLLVYHSPEDQKEEVYRYFDSTDIVWKPFTSENSDSERKTMLMEIGTKQVQALAAMNCLDQGVDVPAIRNAIIISSSGNPMTFIQRRGRVLRKHKGKKHANIHDFIVVPPLSDNIGSLEKSIIKKELKRVDEFSRLSLHPIEVFKVIDKIYSDFNIT